MKVRWTNTAIGHLASIHGYIARDSAPLCATDGRPDYVAITANRPISRVRADGPGVPDLQSSFDGQPVLVEKKGVYFGVSEQARFETVGTNSFIVFKITPENGAAYDYWQPLSDISNIKVFGSVTDAKAYAKKSSPIQERSGSNAKGND